NRGTIVLVAGLAAILRALFTLLTFSSPLESSSILSRVGATILPIEERGTSDAKPPRVCGPGPGRGAAEQRAAGRRPEEGGAVAGRLRQDEPAGTRAQEARPARRQLDVYRQDVDGPEQAA